MASEPHDWTVPASLRALLWWPPVAFVVALVDPGAAALTIAAAGAGLAGFGVVGAAVLRRVRARAVVPGAPEPALAEPGV